ncbi:MAG: hypothetical protein WDZ51_03435 [Pirellulaceae bacterium]
MTQTEAAEILDQEGFTTELGGKINQSIVSRCLAVARYERRHSLGTVALPPAPAPAVNTPTDRPEPKPEEQPAPTETPAAKPDQPSNELLLLLEQMEHEKRQTQAAIRQIQEFENRQQEAIQQMIQEVKRQTIAG